MTTCASLILLCLVVECRYGRRGRIHREGMALQAEQVDLAPAQQARIGRAMGCVAGNTALGLHRRVLKCERTCFVRVAGKANYVLGGRGPELMREEAAVRVVAVVAGNQPLIDPVMERFGEFGLDLQVASETKLRHGCLQQASLDPGRMDGVAVDATDVVLDVLGAQEVRMLLSEFVAAQAAFG